MNLLMVLITPLVLLWLMTLKLDIWLSFQKVPFDHLICTTWVYAVCAPSHCSGLNLRQLDIRWGLVSCPIQETYSVLKRKNERHLPHIFPVTLPNGSPKIPSYLCAMETLPVIESGADVCQPSIIRSILHFHHPSFTHLHTFTPFIKSSLIYPSIIHPLSIHHTYIHYLSAINLLSIQPLSFHHSCIIHAAIFHLSIFHTSFHFSSIIHVFSIQPLSTHCQFNVQPTIIHPSTSLKHPKSPPYL